jgi:hypothetical protein
MKIHADCTSEGTYDEAGSIIVGKLEYKDGCTVEGIYKKGYLYYGSKTYTDGSLAEGYFSQLDSKGSSYLSLGVMKKDNCVYKGIFHGGVIVYGSKTSADEYLEGWFENKKLVSGYKYSNNCYMVGKYKNEQLIEGKMMFLDGSVFEGTLGDNQGYNIYLADGTYIDVDANCIEGKFNIQYGKKCTAQGQVRIYYPIRSWDEINGEEYHGFMLDGLKHGVGYMRYQGRRWTQTWDKGILVSLLEVHDIVN